MWFHDTTQQLTPLQPPKPEPPPLLIGCVSSVRYGTASPTAYRAMGKVMSAAGLVTCNDSMRPKIFLSGSLLDRLNYDKQWNTMLVSA